MRGTVTPVGGRIFFHGNPWPNGHAIKQITWTGRVEPEGLFFAFDLQTEKYDAAEPGIESDESDWKSPIVWGNFHSCHLHADGRGFRVATERKKLDFSLLEGGVFEADKKPRNGDDAAFHIYLLGHDSVAGHRIAFDRRNSNGTYSIRWTGRICLSYVGETRYAHSFEARIDEAALDGIVVPDWNDDVNGRRALANLVPDARRYAWNADKKAFIWVSGPP